MGVTGQPSEGAVGSLISGALCTSKAFALSNSCCIRFTELLPFTPADDLAFNSEVTVLSGGSLATWLPEQIPPHSLTLQRQSWMGWSKRLARCPRARLSPGTGDSWLIDDPRCSLQNLSSFFGEGGGRTSGGGQEVGLEMPEPNMFQ